MKILKKYPEIGLVLIACFFLALIIVYFIFGINEVISEVNRALKVAPAQTGQRFDLDSAAKINWRGALNQ